MNGGAKSRGGHVKRLIGAWAVAEQDAIIHSVAEPLRAAADTEVTVHPSDRDGVSKIRLVVLCPDCGYLLAGLNDEGTCPECGSRYSESEIVLHGSARGRHARLNNSSSRATTRLLVLELFSGIGFIQLWIMTQGPIRWLALSWILVGLAIQLGQRFLAETPGLVRVWMKAAGCYQDDSPAASTLFTLLYWLWGIAGLCGWIGYAVGLRFVVWVAPVALAVAIGALWRKERSAAARRLAEASHTEHSGRNEENLVAWTKIHEVDFSRISTNDKTLYRIRISKYGTPLRADVVDFETSMTREQAEELARRVKAWALAARGIATLP